MALLGEEPLELGVELGGQGLVMRHDQGGPLRRLHDIGDGEGLARARRAQQAFGADDPCFKPASKPSMAVG